MTHKTSRRVFLEKTIAFFSFFSLSKIISAENTKVKLRFAVASDGHYGEPGTSYLTDFPNLVKWINAEKKNKGLDFCVINGDLIHDNPEFLPKVKDHFDDFSVNYYVTRGNHDKVSNEFWKKTWGYDTNHFFETKEYGFILLDNSNEKGEYVCPDIKWFDEKLSQFIGKKQVFVFMHISPRKWTKAGIECNETNDLLAKYKNVKAVFHGHDHDEQGKKIGEKSHFWDAHFGGSWGTSYKGYRVVEINSDGSLYTYQYNPVEKKIENEDKV